MDFPAYLLNHHPDKLETHFYTCVLFFPFDTGSAVVEEQTLSGFFV